MKLHVRRSVAGLIGITVAGVPGFAAIPEPSAIFYGELTNSHGFPLPAGTVVRITRTGQELATYTISHASPAGYAPVLRVPMVNLSDATAQPPGTAKVADTVQLDVVGQTGFAPSPVTITERGLVFHFSHDTMSITDTDGDGIPDLYETGTGTLVSLVNTGTDPNDADTDGDGILDGTEVQQGDDPNWQLGDVNHDHEVNPADVVVLSRFLDGDAPPSFYAAEADLAPASAPNGLVDLADLLLLVKQVD